LARNIDHGFSTLHLVVTLFNGDGHVVFQFPEILLGFGKRVLLRADVGPPLTEMEDIITEGNAESTEIMYQERNAILVAMASVGCDIGNIGA
jgi:hypothetical protein